MVKFRIATAEDNPKLIHLTASSGMAGDIGLRIDRSPDFFSLLKLRGDTKTFVAEEHGNIIGCICVSLQQVFVDGEIYPLQYVGDFKVLEEYRNQGIGLQLCNEVAEYALSQNADLAFLNVSKGNTKPVSFFKNRSDMPDFENIGIFKIYQIIGKKFKPKNNHIQIKETALTDEVLSFFNLHHKNYQLGTVLTPEKFEGTEVFTVRQNDQIIAALCLIDTMTLKQNVITHLSWTLKTILKIINIYGSIAGFSKMPELHQPVKMLYIKYLAVDGNHRSLIKPLINFARNRAFEKSYAYVSIGLHEKDPLNGYLSGLPKLTFKSVGMLLSIKNNRNLVKKIKEGVPYEDYSLV